MQVSILHLSYLLSCTLLPLVSSSPTGIKQLEPTALPIQTESFRYTRTIAGVTVVDTPLVRSAEAFARQHMSDWVFNHVMRSWLLGTLLIQQNKTLLHTVDPEVQAVAAILHDLGWDRTPNSELISKDKRFEIDGAIAARNFIYSHDPLELWDRHRVQLVWDAIALHTQPLISDYKEPEVKITGRGIGIDLRGRSYGISVPAWREINRKFPRLDVAEGVNSTFKWLCATKPETTYDTLMEPWGDHYITGYSAVGHRWFDTKVSDKP